MNLAYIITAYKDEKNLRRLIGALNVNSHFYIHIDLKVNISNFIKELADFENVKFCSNRYFINWGSFQQVLSQKELLKSVFESNIIYDRIICISGTDYPIWSNERIISEFEINKNKEYILGLNLTKLNNRYQYRRISLYHFCRDVRIRNSFLRRSVMYAARNFMRMTPFRKKLETLLDSKRVDIYLGSDYWSLTSDCAKYVYEKMCTEKKLMRYFKYSFTPSEMVVQTIVLNSRFAKNVIPYIDDHIYKGLANLTPLHYIEYSRSIKTFTEEDYDKLINSNKMFFRKASTGISDILLNRIDLSRNNS